MFNNSMPLPELNGFPPNTQRQSGDTIQAALSLMGWLISGREVHSWRDNERELTSLSSCPLFPPTVITL